MLRSWALLAGLALGLTAHGAQSAAINLDFNNNQIPEGWSLTSTSPGSNLGFKDGRLYAGEIDSAGFIQLALMPLSSASVVELSWDSNLTRTYWGNFAGVRLAIGSLDNLSDEYRVQAGAATYTNSSGNMINLGAFNDQVVHFPDLPDGIYRYSATFSQGQIRFSGSLSSSEMFSWTYSSSSIDMTRVVALRLFVYETVGPDVWIDNVHIDGVSAVPEPTSLALLVLGGGLLGLRRR